MSSNDTTRDRLGILRTQLGDIDRQILELVARRNRTAAEIGRAKADLGEATRNFAQEKAVVERARRSADALDLSPDTAEEVLLALIRSSLTVQEKDRVQLSTTGGGRRVLIIGGAGKMGRWLAGFLDSQGFVVEIGDPAGPLIGFKQVDDWEHSPLDQDIIIVAAPMRASASVLQVLAERAPSGVVFDIGSLKSPLRSGFDALREAGVRVTSVHPMFGPSTELLSGRHVIFIDLGDAEATAVARSLFDSTMAEQVEMDLDAHDRLIAFVLGLSHAVNIAFFTALAESGEDAPRLKQMSSTTFDSQLEVATRVAEENPWLYYEIQALNDYGAEPLRALHDAVDRLQKSVVEGDEEAFVAMMKQGNSYLRQ